MKYIFIAAIAIIAWPLGLLLCILGFVWTLDHNFIYIRHWHPFLHFMKVDLGDYIEAKKEADRRFAAVKAATAKKNLWKVYPFNPGKVYGMRHVPSGEYWLSLGIDREKDLVCSAGFPFNVAHLSDMEDFKEIRDLHESELKHREKYFAANNWI